MFLAHLGRVSEENVKTKQRLSERIFKELSVHAAIEEQLLYPALRKTEANGQVDEALHEHQQVKELLPNLDKMSPEDGGFDQTMNEVRTSPTTPREEKEMLPRLQKAMSRNDLEALGNRMKKARKGRGWEDGARPRRQDHP